MIVWADYSRFILVTIRFRVSGLACSIFLWVSEYVWHCFLFLFTLYSIVSFDRFTLRILSRCLTRCCELGMEYNVISCFIGISYILKVERRSETRTRRPFSLPTIDVISDVVRPIEILMRRNLAVTKYLRIISHRLFHTHPNQTCWIHSINFYPINLTQTRQTFKRIYREFDTTNEKTDFHQF